LGAEKVLLDRTSFQLAAWPWTLYDGASGDGRGEAEAGLGAGLADGEWYAPSAVAAISFIDSDRASFIAN